jgi:hypothetical protein
LRVKNGLGHDATKAKSCDLRENNGDNGRQRGNGGWRVKGDHSFSDYG